MMISVCMAKWRRGKSLRFGLFSWFAISSTLVFASIGMGQSGNTGISDHLESGEFSIAIEMANQLDADNRDAWLSKIAQSQMDSGASQAAFQTAEQVVYDTTRSDVMNGLSDRRLGQPAGGPVGGRAGGISLSDFQNLIDLIQNTISTDTWTDTGSGLGTIQPFPAGVYVDAAGTLRRIKTVKTPLVRKDSDFDSGNREVALKTQMRKISLTRLEKAAQMMAAQGQPLDSTMQNLAGIYEIKYLMMYPETGDVVIAGPAGPWRLDQDRRPVNIETGKPVLQLDDLVVCMRNAWDENGKFGCSIVPRKQNLAKTKDFLGREPAAGKRWAEKLRETLGKQDIEVFGIDPETHLARVIVEADYRMKLVGMGLDSSIPEVPSFLDRVELNADGTPPQMDVLRWWFTLNYDDIVADADRTTFAFRGTGVKVLSEDEFIDQQGERIHTGKSTGANKEFADDFTMHFDKLADKYPVYRQLKNVFDLALVSNLIRHQSLSTKTNWHRTFFDSPVPGHLSYVVRTERAPNQVDSVMNEKIIRVRKKNSTLKHRITGVSGGVAVDVNAVISKKFVVDAVGGELDENSKNGKPQGDEITWWWD